MIVTVPFGGQQQAEKDGRKNSIPIHSGMALQNSCPLKGFDCLIGRDIMMHWSMTYNGKDGYIIICE